MTETCGKLLFLKKMWLTVSQCGNAPLCGFFWEMKSEKRNWWKKRSSTAAAWWIPFRQRKHILCKRNSIYRHREVLRSVVLLSVSNITHPNSGFTIVHLLPFWSQPLHFEIMKMYCSTNVGLDFEGDTVMLLILSFCQVALFKLAQCIIIDFLKTKSALDRVKWRIG